MARKESKVKAAKKAGGARGSGKKASKKTRPAKVVRSGASSKRAAAAKKLRAKARAKPTAGLGLKEAAAAVFKRLSANGHDPILSGQSCAAIYGGAGIKTSSIEFAIREFSVGPVSKLMAELGFALKESRTFACDVSPFEVTLIAAPLMIGDDSVSGSRTIKTQAGPLKLVTPTDCVRQRLSMFYRWGDRAALSDAVQVAKRQAVDMELVARWSEWEWATDRFQEFVKALKEAR
jgi:hypothetical protein